MQLQQDERHLRSLASELYDHTDESMSHKHTTEQWQSFKINLQSFDGILKYGEIYRHVRNNKF